MSEERIINLEIKFAHIEDFIENLNLVVIDQAKMIDALKKEILDLKRSANANNGVDATRTLSDDKPPHY
jgi:SlyX protein